VSLPWSKRPFRAAKGVMAEPTPPTIPPDFDSKAKEAVLVAIARSRRWLDRLIAGGSLAEIARSEGKGERQIRLLMPLAFVPPATVRELVSQGGFATITEMAQQGPLFWQDCH
jgi:hypothetical protein